MLDCMQWVASGGPRRLEENLDHLIPDGFEGASCLRNKEDKNLYTYWIVKLAELLHDRGSLP